MKSITRKTLAAGIVAGMVLFTSCAKEPTASFTTDKTAYTAGDVVHLTNTSTHAGSYKWTMPDGQTSTTTNVDFTLNTSDPGGTETFKLESFSSNGKKSNEASHSVTVSPLTGSVVFWSDNLSGSTVLSVTVSVTDGTTISQGKISSFLSSAPSCGANYCYTYTKAPGTYTMTAIDGAGSTWPAHVVTITGGSCASTNLQ